MSRADQLLTLFCFVDDFLKSHPRLAAWRTSHNAHPKFSDAEVITVTLMQAVFEVTTLKQAFLLVKSLFPTTFPHLPHYACFANRLHLVEPLIGHLLFQVEICSVGENTVFVLDSKPIPVCKPIRHGRVRLLRQDGAYFGKNSVGWYLGYKRHILSHSNGTTVSAFLTPANWHDRDVVVAGVAEGLPGDTILLADLAYRDAKGLEPLLRNEYGIVLVTPGHASKEQRALVSSVRERIEACVNVSRRCFQACGGSSLTGCFPVRGKDCRAFHRKFGEFTRTATLTLP